MSALPVTTGPADGDLIDRIARSLETTGYIILPEVLPETIITGLFVHFKSLDSGDFIRAGIGHEADYKRNPFVRSDRIHWLDPDNPVTTVYFDWIERLRSGLNRRLFLGLFDYECHFAYYSQGAFYKKHLDAFQGNNSRVITTVLYLNPDWQPQDGGELVIYAPESDQVLEQVVPTFGKMVIFLSEEFPHEVLPVNRSRYSLSGWFRVNNTLGDSLDPPR